MARKGPPKAPSRILKALRLRRPAADRRDVTRAEFNRIVALVEERGDVIDRLTKELDIQLRRIAQMQLELDEVRLAWRRSKRAQSTGSGGPGAGYSS